ncbi:MAG: LptF/LptG family permease [Epsilonproteobacteria bacterium]|nr:LptF/LptG family permease [Campylobacterota bacterium]
MLAFKYISFHYLKYFLVIMLALVMFLVGFDYMDNAEKLSNSANLVLIYLTYKAFFAIDMLLPLALVFAMISTKIFLIRSNALVSFYSLGYSKIDILKPFVIVSSSVVLLFILMHSWSSFARADEFSNNIRKNAEYLSPTRDLFFTYQNKYVYFSKMNPLEERAFDIRVFSVTNGSLQEVLVANEARYQDEHWYISEADIITKPAKMDFESLGISVTNQKELRILEGFRPKMLDQVYEGKVNFTIYDALSALWLFRDQNVNTASIRGALYKIIVYPFFVPALVVIIFFFVPISPRFLNVSLFSFGAILATLVVWGVLFMLIELSNNKTIPSEIGVVAPVALLFLAALRTWRKNSISV